MVGAAGSASAVALPENADIAGGVTALDTAAATDTVDTASKSATGLAGEAGSKVTDKAVPAATENVGGTAKKTAPVAQKPPATSPAAAARSQGDAAGATTDVAGETAPAELPGGGLGGGLLGGVPVGGL